MLFTQQKHCSNYGCSSDSLCFQCIDRNRAIAWAHTLLAGGDFLILDTETADLRGEIIEIGIIDASGNVLLDQRIKPAGQIAPGAQAVHGISIDDLQDAPTFPDVYPEIKSILENRLVIIYNAAYDTACITQDIERHGLERMNASAQCAMKIYAEFFGDWSEYHGSYKWKPLNGTHGAIGDCQTTLERLKEMAGYHENAE